MVAGHASGLGATEKYFGRAPLGGVLNYGGVGVDIFFIISGFIIVVTSLAPGTLAPRKDAGEFLKHRFTRVVPFLWVCVLAYAGARYLGRGVFEAGPYVRALFLIPFGTVQPDIVWTLRHEALFYALFAACVLSSTTRLGVLGLWFAGSAAAGLLTIFLGYSPFSSLPGGDVFFSAFNVEFGVGTLIGLAYLKREVRQRYLPGGFILAVAGTSVVVAASWLLDYHLGDPRHMLPITLLSAALVGAAVFLAPEAGIVARTGQLLGDASYSIYLVHLGIVSAVLGFWSRIQPDQDVLLVTIAICVIAAVAGIIAHLIIERPLLAWCARVIHQRTAPMKAPVAG